MTKRGPVQVVSAPMGKEHVHFEAHKAERLDQEMKSFYEWSLHGARGVA
jgi:hypothetical protein